MLIMLLQHLFCQPNPREYPCRTNTKVFIATPTSTSGPSEMHLALNPFPFCISLCSIHWLSPQFALPRLPSIFAPMVWCNSIPYCLISLDRITIARSVMPNLKWCLVGTVGRLHGDPRIGTVIRTIRGIANTHFIQGTDGDYNTWQDGPAEYSGDKAC